jgi:hypothetical protein
MSNPTDISAKINGLIPYQKYNYSFTAVDANWPTVINPISGSFTASATSGSVDATVYFCPSKNSCDNCDGLLPYNECLCNLGEQSFTKIKMLFSLEGDPNTVFNSQTIKVICNDCLPKVEMSLPSGTRIDKEKPFDINLIFDNLKGNQTYIYNIEALNSDWPIYLSSTSGLLVSNGVQDMVNLFGVYCGSVGSCPNGDTGILPYTVPSGNCRKHPWQLPQTTLRVSLKDTDCDTVIHYSDIITVRCKDCVANYVSVSVDMSNINNCA